jgi:hypothetical protein
MKKLEEGMAAKRLKKEGVRYSAVFESFELFCGQNAFLSSI